MSLARRQGDLLFLSGQLAFVPGSRIIAGDIIEQTHQVMRNIAGVLEDHGLTMESIIKTSVWITDPQNFAGFNKAYSEHFPSSIYPARSTVVSQLVVPNALIEIEALAAFSSS